MAGSLLLIDDDPEILTMLSGFFERRGWAVARAGTGTGGIRLHDREAPDVVLLDLELPDISGLRVLELLQERQADSAVVMLTGHGSIAAAVEAMRLGAENFLTKPVELSHLEAAVERALEKAELRRRNRYYVARRVEETPPEMALGRSPGMRELERKLELLAAGDSTVLLLGESGTGKGWAAQLLHARSRRAEAPFVEVNCAGLTATFLDSELFGHEKGAFTDAKARKPGLFEIADGGTVFLDEIGNLAPELQPKLLKVIESRKFRRLGGTREIEVDVRLIAATNRDLKAAVEAGRFREDLYYRLAVLPLQLPPLRERGPEEIADLACRLLVDMRRRTGRGPTRFDPEALHRLQQHRWPGNIRELRNVLERVLLVADGADEIRPEHLPAELASPGALAVGSGEEGLSLEEVERRHIARVLAHCGGNRSRTARVLGISRATLYDKIGRYGLS